jgi:hypothetical protein
MTHETKDLPREGERVSEKNSETGAASRLSPEARRRFIKAGFVGVPLIITLKGRQPWAFGDPGQGSIMQSINAGSSAHPGFQPAKGKK